jgi:polygalacturonase
MKSIRADGGLEKFVHERYAKRQRPPGIFRNFDQRIYMKKNFWSFNHVRIAAILIVLVAVAIPSVDAEIIPVVAAPKIPKRTVSLADFGTGDGRTLNTEAFKKALDVLAEKGGGKLVVPPGIWLTGPIQLRSHTELHVERGALIQFSRDFKLYPITVIDLKGEKSVDSTSPIFAENADSIAITGEGVIDGGGEAWRALKKEKLSDGDWKALVKSGGVVNERGDTWFPSREFMEGGRASEQLQKSGSLNLADYEPFHNSLRPRMVRLIGCKKVLLEDVTFQNPPNWTMNPELCEDVSILNVQVRNSPTAQNSDALDLESCRHAIIRGCVFDTGDDGICIKSGLDAAGRRIGVPTEDVLVENCVVYHAHGGFTIGSEMSGSVRNIRVNNCLFMGTDTGLRFKSTRGRGGVVEKIFISNINMVDIPGDAINFNLYYGGKSPLDDTATTETNFPPVTEETPQFKDIHIENVICRGARNAIVLQGLPEMPLDNITLKNVSITSQNRGSVVDAGNVTFENVQVQSQSDAPLKTFRVKNCQLDLSK